MPPYISKCGKKVTTIVRLTVNRVMIAMRVRMLGRIGVIIGVARLKS
jgi:hypothetical protein